MKRYKTGVLACLLMLLALSVHAQQYSIEGQVSDAAGQSLGGVDIFVEETGQISKSDPRGYFQFGIEQLGEYTLLLFAEGYQSTTVVVPIDSDSKGTVKIELPALSYDLTTVEVGAEGAGGYSMRNLHNVEGVAIYAAKNLALRSYQFPGSLVSVSQFARFSFLTETP